MTGFWIQVLLAMVTGAAGVFVALAYVDRGGHADRPPSPEPARCVAVITGADVWDQQLRRCEGSVLRASRAVDAVSSVPAREALRSVVRRMEAELPDVRALVELGHRLEADDRRHGRTAATGRVHRQLTDAVVRFAGITDQVLDAVLELVVVADFHRLHGRSRALRAQFPLLRPMSALFDRTPAPPLVDAPAAPQPSS